MKKILVINNLYIYKILLKIDKDNKYFFQNEFPKYDCNNGSYYDLIIDYYTELQINDIESKMNYVKQRKTIYLGLYANCLNWIVGPLVDYNTKGCLHCFYQRLLDNGNLDYFLTDGLNNNYYNSFENIISYFIVEEFQKYFINQNSQLIDCIYKFDTSINDISIHKFTAVENCYFCGNIENDFPLDISKKISNEENPLIDITNLRSKEVDISIIKEELINYKLGIICNIYKDMNSSYVPTVCVEFKSNLGKYIHGSYGRNNTYGSSERSAVLEFLERYACMSPKSKRTITFDSYKNLKEIAIDPNEFILPDISQTTEPGYNLSIYNSNKKYNWVWGFSLKQNRNILVPEQIAYYDLPRDSNKDFFVLETSNGTAVGGNLKEAILYAIFEICERDAYLVTWYNKLNLKRIKVSSCEPYIQRIIKLIRSQGHEIYLFDMTMEHNIPSVLCLFKSETAITSSYIAAGCHINPNKAIESAVVEVVSSVPIYNVSLKGKKDDAKKLFEDELSVQKMEDHILLYSYEKSTKYYEFLLSNNEEYSIDELYPSWKFMKKEIYISEIYNEIISKILKFHKEIIVIETTNNILKKHHLTSVKVLIPSMLNMTFGHQYRRVNIDRVKKAPIVSGRAEKEIEDKDINLVPHAFP